VAAITAFLIALLSFAILGAYTPGSRISKEQALAVIEGSSKVDSRIVTDSTPEIVSLCWMKLDWLTLDWIRESALYHMFLAASPPTDYRPFWLVKYGNRMLVDGESWDLEGKYMVDATSGELMASLERAYPTRHDSDLSPPIIYFWTLSMDPPQADFDEPYSLKPGETLNINAIVKAGPAYDASLPLIFEATDIRPGLTVRLNATNSILSTGGSVSVRYSVARSGVVGPNPTPNPNWGFGIDVHDIFGAGQGLSVFIEP
jgi:hypothetical protein